MTPDTLLTELETLSHDQRLQRMIALGKQARTDPATATLLADLTDTGGTYTRLLRLYACIGSEDSAFVLASMGDASRTVRGFAAKLAPHLCSDAELAQALAFADKRLRTVLLRRLPRSRKAAVVDVFLQSLVGGEARTLGRWLPFGSAAFVQTHLARVADGFDWHDWSRLARRHPDLVAAALRQQITEQTAPDPRLRTRVNAVLDTLSRLRPDEALRLVRDLLKADSPSRLTLQELARIRPNEMAEILLAHADGGAATVDLSVAASKLTGENLRAILQRRAALLYRSDRWYRASPEQWLKKLTPERRRDVFAIAGVGWRSAEGILPTAVVAVLPADLREGEARRHLALPALATRPSQRLPYAAFLPWDEAKAVLEPSMGSPNPDLRTVALGARIEGARYDADRLPEVLALVRARANEQDPIRGAMLAALAALPPSRWTGEHLLGLEQILRDALKAADLSPGTAAHAAKLVIALLPFHAPWAADWTGKITLARGQISFYGLGERLTDADVQKIAPLLLPVFESWETRERETYLYQAAASFGRRLRVFGGLVDLLERVVNSTRNGYLAGQLLLLLAEHRADRMATFVPALLASDPSAITLSSVHEYLHRKRQDLLTPFLGQRAYAGRFGTGKTVFVLPLASGFHRWTPSQQAQFSQTLERVTGDGKRDIPARLRAVDQIAALLFLPPAPLIALAALDADPTALRDAALRALARLDAGEGIPALTLALGDARARIAIYALRTAILEMPGEQALALLQSVPTEKVTVAKEVVRLLGELKTPATYPVLLEMETRPLHRDVRVALLRALWDHLEQDATWPVLSRAGASPDPAVASGVVRIPTDRLSPTAQNRLLSLLALLLTHPDARVRLDTLSRCADLPVTDARRVLLAPLLNSLGSPFPDETGAAARAVFATYAEGTSQDSVAIGAGIVQIKQDRRVLQTTLDTLHSALSRQRSRLRATVRAVLDALADDPLTARARAELAVAGLPWDGVIAALSRLAQTGELHAEALIAAVAALEASGSRDTEPDGENGLETLETAFGASADDRLRRLALAALVARSTTTGGWTPALRKRLEIYRLDASPLVAGAAQFTLPSPDSPLDPSLFPVGS